MVLSLATTANVLRYNAQLVNYKKFISILKPFKRGVSRSIFLRNPDNYNDWQKNDWRRLSPFFNFWMKTKIEKLEKEANENPNNPTVQYVLLRSVLEIDPDYVIKRVESGRYAVDNNSREVYYRAVSLRDKQSIPRFQDVFKKPIISSKTMRQMLKRALIVTAICLWIIYSLNPGKWTSDSSFDLGSFMGGDFNKSDEAIPEKISMRFNDVKGNEETKQELREIVDFLKNPGKYQKVGCRISSGVLMVGPPGTGKTMLAKAIAGEASVPFFYATGAEFDEMFVGVGAMRVRKLFAKARKNSPCIIFIDELDAIGAKRTDTGLAPYARMTINQLLTEMDGFKENNIVLIGATNDPKVLDPALVRAGRFDTHIEIPLPCYKDRIDIIRYYVQKVTGSKDINVERIAALTPGASGADLSNLVNQAAVHAVNRNSLLVTMSDIEWARDKILMGRERKAVVFTEEEKKRIADHEAGHSIVAYYTVGSRKLHKATIIPRGSALGVTHLLPERDEYLTSYQQMLASIDVSMGGRAAEEIIYGPDHITSGCSSDLANATHIAKRMISAYGYSQEFGLNALDVEKSNPVSPELDVRIHDEVKKILDASYLRTVKLLKERLREHKRLSDALLVNETLEEEEIKKILA